MDWPESGVFCVIRADGCARKNRGTVGNAVFYAVSAEAMKRG
jgi:hypothetical protein